MIAENINDDITNVLGVCVGNFSELDLRRKSVVATKDVRANSVMQCASNAHATQCHAQFIVDDTRRNTKVNTYVGRYKSIKREEKGENSSPLHSLENENST